MWKQVFVKGYGDQMVRRAFAGSKWLVWVTSRRRRACMHEMLVQGPRAKQ
jgi:hypothetical protein